MQLCVVADKRGRREIERQLFDRGIELKLPSGVHPVRDALRDAAVQLLKIRLHWAGLKGDGQRFTVQSMLIEIEQHQAARKKPLQHRAPTHRGREQSLLIEKDEFVPLGTKQRDTVEPEEVVAVNPTIFRMHSVDMRDGI